MAGGVLGDDLDVVITIINVFCILFGIGVTVAYWLSVKSYSKEAATKEPTSEDSALKSEAAAAAVDIETTSEDVFSLLDIIKAGTTSFFSKLYKITAIFIAVFGVLVFVLSGIKGHMSFNPTDPKHHYSSDWVFGAFCAVAFLVGATTSLTAGHIGMSIMSQTNGRVTMKCLNRNIHEGFTMALKGGMAMGFCFFILGVANLFILIAFYKLYFSSCDKYNDCKMSAMYQAVAAYGLGASSVALFGRVGGGIFTKAADVSTDLVYNQFKVKNGIQEDDRRNPATLADNVGDNVGCVAGTGSDLFGSFAASTCATMVILASANNTMYWIDGAMHPMVDRWSTMCFPLSITATGLVVCFITSLFATHCGDSKMKPAHVEPALKRQIVISTVLMTPMIFLLTAMLLPEHFYVEASVGIQGTAPKSGSSHLAVCESRVWNPTKQRSYEFPVKMSQADFQGPLCLGALDSTMQRVTWYEIGFCVLTGLWMGLLIGFVSDYYTSKSYSPVQEVAQACHHGAATNILYGLALGYTSTAIPVLALAITIFISYGLGKMLGVSCAALGMLTNMGLCLSIDGFGHIADNADSIAIMTNMPKTVRSTTTDALDAAGNTTSSITKGFATGSAAMVSFALFCAFCIRADIKNKDISVLEPNTFFGLLMGAMMPYVFSAMSLKSVGTTAKQMLKKIEDQFESANGKLIFNKKVNPLKDMPMWYDECIQVGAEAALGETMWPVIVLVGSPLLVGVVLGKYALSGLLVGVIISGVQLAMSASNAGGAWDNAKKKLEQDGLAGSAEHAAAMTGDTVGDPLKDTAGPAVNVLMKLMAVIALVFAPLIAATRDGHGLLGCSLVADCKA